MFDLSVDADAGESAGIIGGKYDDGRLYVTPAVSAMLDRLLHHGHVLKCGPRSWRTKTDLPPQEAAG